MSRWGIDEASKTFYYEYNARLSANPGYTGVCFETFALQKKCKSHTFSVYKTPGTLDFIGFSTYT